IPEEVFEEGRFDLSEWDTTKGDGLYEAFNPGFTCGFAGCAIGWAAHARIIPGLGMHGTRPSFDGEDGWEAVAKAFGLSKGEALELFAEGSYRESPTPRDVAGRIRRLLAKPSTAQEGRS